ncbi:MULTISPECIES: hypothetical protein [Paenibacillus]|uniref:hypothetical protein n=1 Tax=Paenibacillus TaxID=44249 RepID=UPI0011AB2BC1|nr:hypothetical protein [Paenibacillus sp. IHBB 10380]
MWHRELKAAINKKQPVTIRLKDGEVRQGIPEQCTEYVKLRMDNGVVWIPTADIDHVSRLIQFQTKKDPAGL